MRRRFVQAFLVWISLIGLIPAALACAQTMAERDCCPPGHISMPCDDEQGPASIEAAACCATPSVAPSAIQAVGEHHASALPVLDSSPACLTSPTLPPSASHGYFKRSADPPETILPDRSLTYLQTARLRL
jgi:hypothetical protein